MGADQVAQTADGPQALRGPQAPATDARENRFWYGLALAAALHAALIFTITKSSPRQMGERSGRPDGISVVLVDEADLNSKNTFREDGSAAAPAATIAPAAPPTPPAPPRKLQPPAPKEATTPTAQPAPPPSPRPLEERKIMPDDLDQATRDRPPTPAPGTVQSEPRTAAKHALKQEPAPPQDQAIPNIPVAPGGRAAAVMRPPGATRSGENDEFGRGVIRALRQTMPSPAGQLGRVTVKLLLSNSGNLVEVQLVRGAGISGLDQSVVFAVRQSSFPIPPAGSTLVDRTFLVTYIYN